MVHSIFTWRRPDVSRRYLFVSHWQLAAVCLTDHRGSF
jgi:hypothetical protein